MIRFEFWNEFISFGPIIFNRLHFLHLVVGIQNLQREPCQEVPTNKVTTIFDYIS